MSHTQQKVYLTQLGEFIFQDHLVFNKLLNLILTATCTANFKLMNHKFMCISLENIEEFVGTDPHLKFFAENLVRWLRCIFPFDGKISMHVEREPGRYHATPWKVLDAATRCPEHLQYILPVSVNTSLKSPSYEQYFSTDRLLPVIDTSRIPLNHSDWEPTEKTLTLPSKSKLAIVTIHAKTPFQFKEQSPVNNFIRRLVFRKETNHESYFPALIMREWLLFTDYVQADNVKNLEILRQIRDDLHKQCPNNKLREKVCNNYFGVNFYKFLKPILKK